MNGFTKRLTSVLLALSLLLVTLGVALAGPAGGNWLNGSVGPSFELAGPGSGSVLNGSVGPSLELAGPGSGSVLNGSVGPSSGSFA